MGIILPHTLQANLRACVNSIMNVPAQFRFEPAVACTRTIYKIKILKYGTLCTVPCSTMSIILYIFPGALQCLTPWVLIEPVVYYIE